MTRRLLRWQYLVVLAAVIGVISLCMVSCQMPGRLANLAPEAIATIESAALLATMLEPSATATAVPTTTLLPPPTIVSLPNPTATPSPIIMSEPVPATGQAIIVDHTSTNINAVPQVWIEEAKRVLHIGYGRTSHGRQLITGMEGLIGFANGGGRGLSLPEDIFQFSPSGNNGGEYLHLFEGAGWGDGYLRGDVGYYPDWVNETRAYLGTPDPVTGRGTTNPEINVIIWAWCVQVSGYTEQQMLDQYLLPMSQLEIEYPGVTFVYMTGVADGTGEEGNLYERNQQIRAYSIANGKVLYDYYDIELYDPDGNYYGDKAVNGHCEYDSNGDGNLDGNWCLEWQSAYTEGVDWYTPTEYCPHSYPVNCNQKAYAVWWLWARLAGWDGN